MPMCEWDPRCAVLGRESRSKPLLVHYVGEVSGAAKQELFANAAALLLPVRWLAQVGLVMVEALACGAPVIAFPEGATAEIVVDETGMPVAKEAEIAQAIERLGSIDPERYRAGVAARYDVSAAADGYEHVHRRAIYTDRGHKLSLAPRTALDTGQLPAKPMNGR
jgi:glycosyltransferase involved in cell wall biosynthesis